MTSTTKKQPTVAQRFALWKQGKGPYTTNGAVFGAMKKSGAQPDADLFFGGAPTLFALAAGMIWWPYILPLSPTISSQSPSANLAPDSNSSGHGGLSPPSHQVIVTAARSPSAGKNHRVMDESGAV